MKLISKIFFLFISILLIFQFSGVKLYPGWFRHYGGSEDDRGYSVQQTTDGGYIVAGNSVSYSFGADDFAIYRLNSIGNKVWFKHYGGTFSDYAESVKQTSDGGYIIAGSMGSFSYGNIDLGIYKLNSNGNKVWFKHYGGSNGDYAASIQQTSDGGYIVAGTTSSYTNGGSDFAIYKLNSNGNKVWFKHYGGANDEWGRSIQQTSDGGYIVAGYTNSFTFGSWDFAIYRLNSSGDKVWFKHYGGSAVDYARSIQQTSDGGYVVTGHTYSYTYGQDDFAVYRLDSSGNNIWFKHYGGTNYDAGYSIQQTSDGGYIIAGKTQSFSYGLVDLAIYKLNSSGNKVWFRHYGGTAEDYSYSIQQTSESGYIVTGRTKSFTHGKEDVAIYKLDSNGDK